MYIIVNWCLSSTTIDSIFIPFEIIGDLMELVDCRTKDLSRFSFLKTSLFIYLLNYTLVDLLDKSNYF